MRQIEVQTEALGMFRTLPLRQYKPIPTFQGEYLGTIVERSYSFIGSALVTNAPKVSDSQKIDPYVRGVDHIHC